MQRLHGNRCAPKKALVNVAKRSTTKPPTESEITRVNETRRLSLDLRLCLRQRTRLRLGLNRCLRCVMCRLRLRLCVGVRVRVCGQVCRRRYRTWRGWLICQRRWRV